MKRFLHKITILLIIIVTSSCASNLQNIEQLFQSQKYQEAISDLNEYLFFHVSDVKAFHMRARCYEEIGRLDKAKQDYERILLIDDQYAQAYAGLGKLLFDGKKYEDAELRLLRAANLDPTDFEIFYLLGRTQLMLQEYKTAEQWLRRAAEIKPEFAKTYFYTGMALALQGDALGAAASFNSYIKYEPDNLIGRYNRGFALMSAGYLPWALEDFDAVLEQDPDHIEALARKGHCLAKMGNPEGCQLLQNAATKGSEYAKSNLDECG